MTIQIVQDSIARAPGLGEHRVASEHRAAGQGDPEALGHRPLAPQAPDERVDLPHDGDVAPGEEVGRQVDHDQRGTPVLADQERAGLLVLEGEDADDEGIAPP